METQRKIAGSFALIALLALAAPARAEDEATIEKDAESAPGPELRARLDLSHLTAYDAQAIGQVAFSDLRLVAEATRLAGLPASFHVDGRARRGWDEDTEDRLTVRDAYLRIGEDDDAWRVDLGRQVVRSVAAAEVDGLRVHRRLAERATATLFGGLMPHPITGDLDPDFTSVGAGYEHLGRTVNHSAGAVASWYQGEIDRVYLTQRGYLRAGRDLSLSSFAIVDLPQDSASQNAVDLTSLIGTVRYRPWRWLDSSLAASHHHTVLPGKWWTDWLSERRRAVGFVLDGEDPVGTRITSVRWTNNLRLGRSLTPYVRARRDWRHNDDARGYEGRAGVKWTRGTTYVDSSYAYRNYFTTKSHLAGGEIGRESTLWGVEAGAYLLQSLTKDSGAKSRAYDVSLMSWLLIGELLGLEHRLHLVLQYQGLFEPESDLHAFFAQLGYRV